MCLLKYHPRNSFRSVRLSFSFRELGCVCAPCDAELCEMSVKIVGIVVSSTILILIGTYSNVRKVSAGESHKEVHQCPSLSRASLVWSQAVRRG